MNINFELYKIFYFVAKFQSFSKAAQKLYITQSAVSQAIKNLEKLLGTKLFLRKNRKVQLTEEGKLFYMHISQAYNFIKTAENKFIEMQNLQVGEIRVGVSDTVCKYYLMKYLRNFYNKYPQIKIQVINRTSSGITQMLKNGLIDIGIITLPTDLKDIEITEFAEVEDIFVASYKFENLKNKKISFIELATYPLLLLDKNSTTRKNLDELLKLQNITITPQIQLESMDLLIEFAKMGLGIAFVLKESVSEEIENGLLFKLNISEKIPLRKLGICTLKNVPLSQAAKKFIELL